MDAQSERPFFSICIPCFNHGEYIGRTIQSVLTQDFKDFEIIVADNASTDDSREVVRSFDDARLRLIENRYNIGFTPNLQQVTRHARGEFINLLSSDDIMNPGALRTYAELIFEQQSNRHRLVFMSQAWDIDSSDKIIGYRTKDGDRLLPMRVKVPSNEEVSAQEHHTLYNGLEVFKNCMLVFNTPGVFCSMVYSRELWKAVEGYNSTQLMDPDKHFITKVLRCDPLVIFVNRPLYSYRTHEMGQAMQQARERTLKFQLDQYSYLMQYDENWLKGTGVTRSYQRKLFINRDCLAQALVALAEGHWTYSVRLLAFACSTYPGIVIRQCRSWALTGMLIIGPIGILLARSLYKLHLKKVPSLAEVSEVKRQNSRYVDRELADV